MTAADLAELERLLARYRDTWPSSVSRNAMATARRHLETALVRHADALIQSAHASLGRDDARSLPRRIATDGSPLDH